MFLQENQKDRKSEKEKDQFVVRTSSSASAVMSGASKRNIQQLGKKSLEKKKDKQHTLEDAVQEVV